MDPNSDNPTLWRWKERECGHVYLLDDEVEEACPFCAHLEPFMDEIIADAMARLAIRSLH